MAKKIGRIVVYVVLILGILAGAVALFGPPYIKNKARKSFPMVEGEIQIPGLDGEVRIFRDAYGVPHIYATTHHDLFLAQGYVHAQDRFWQMDFWRHQGAGRLSELLGKPMLETDRFLRTLGWERIAEQELELLGEEELGILEAYSAGVNAYLDQVSGSSLSLEYYFLNLLNKDYQPAPWNPVNSLTWTKAMAWDLKANLDSEIDRALMLKTLPRNQLEFIYPSYPEDHPIIVPDFPVENSEKNNSAQMDGTPAGNLTSLLAPLYTQLQTSLSDLDQITGGGVESLGSNSWAVSGELTDTGKPYLANDPHLGAQMPSIWYEVGLHCLEITDSCQLNVAGFSFAGAPGVVIGHNDRIAWGVTNVGPDVMDLYIEKINPENPAQYLTTDGWVDMETIVEVIQIAGEEPVELQVNLTKHGPVIGSVYGLENFTEESGLAIPDNYALALQWTALEPTCIFCAIWNINLASNWEEFREAARDFAVPAQNLTYADVDGNIAYQMPGNIPIRVEGHDGMLPVPGWNGEYDWQGFIPFEELPHSYNPSQGYIVTANNAVVDENYPYLITEEWSLGFRANRIVTLLESTQDPISINYLKKMQGDNYDELAAILVPLILEQTYTDPDLQAAQDLLRGWNYQADLDSAPAALYMVFWQHFVENATQDNLPGDFQIGVDSRGKEIIRQLLTQPENPWWDDNSTPERENLEDILQLTLEESYQELVKNQGNDPTDWRWGELHTITFKNQVMDSFPIIKKAFNRGPFQTSGGSEIVNATGWESDNPYVVNWLPSMRMIVDLNNLDNSLSIHTTGQSGHAYHPHYIDLADLWRKIYYHPMPWDIRRIQSQAESLLILRP
jgi:penicillin amidase